MKIKYLLDFLRWIVFIPGAFACSYVASNVLKAFPEVLERFDLGIVAISVFVANLINSCLWGASFAISGLWIAPKRNIIVNAILSTTLGIFCVFICWNTWYYSFNGWSNLISIIVFNIFAVLGSVAGGLMYIEGKNKTN